MSEMHEHGQCSWILVRDYRKESTKKSLLSIEIRER
jgi:hypothetical protein